MKKKYIILQVMEVSSEQLSDLIEQLNSLIYVKIGNIFYISCSNRIKNSLKNYLLNNQINFILTFVNIKAGGDFEAIGLNTSQINELKRIILLNV